MDGTKTAYAKALTLLARREHSQLELKQKLLLREHPPEDIDAVIAELKAQGLQSDERFTEAYIRTRARRGFGPRRIEIELRERGIGEDMIGAHLDAYSEMWKENIHEVWRKKYNVIASDFDERAKQMTFLQYRGFTTEQIKWLMQNENERYS